MTFLPKSSTGQQEIVNMIIKMADLESEEEFDYSSPEAVDRMIQCTTQVKMGIIELALFIQSIYE